MATIPPPTAILVAVDFSPGSRRALETALSWRTPETDVTVVHVIDTSLARRLDAAGVCAAGEAIDKMRERARRELDMLAREFEPSKVETMLVEGVPFAEIVKIGSDLDCDLIVIGTHGDRPELQEVLFGSTAEKVLRAARQPVLCIP
jgi:nucleotide-binding universal stress UspA family protein